MFLSIEWSLFRVPKMLQARVSLGYRGIGNRGIGALISPHPELEGRRGIGYRGIGALTSPEDYN